MRRSILTLTLVGLLVVGLVAPAVAAPKRAPAPGDQSIAQIAIGANFTELVGALAYVDADEDLDPGLVDLFLNGTDQYTVFAPTNQAFRDLYADFGVSGIEELPAPVVLDVLLYHVAEGRRAANSVVPPVRPRSIATLQGSSLTVTSAGVIKTPTQEAGFVPGLIDVSASNGIIHAVDTVLLP
jgi:uncharacterized surface protein with fasciclin (FAS1) repeats